MKIVDSSVVKKHSIGWNLLHVCIDDVSSPAFTELLPEARKKSARAFVTWAIAFFRAHGARVEGFMTNNGSAYSSHVFRDLNDQSRLKHIRTKPYTPRTNDPERFIQTSLREWAYRNAYQTSKERTRAMQTSVTSYKYNRSYSILDGEPPASRLNNVLGFDS